MIIILYLCFEFIWFYLSTCIVSGVRLQGKQQFSVNITTTGRGNENIPANCYYLCMRHVGVKNEFFDLQNIIVRNASEEIKTMDLQRKNQPHLL